MTARFAPGSAHRGRPHRPRRTRARSRAASTSGEPSGPWPEPATCGGLRWRPEPSGGPAVNPAGYYGLYRFDTGTWGTVGGRGLPSNAFVAERIHRANLLDKSRGRSL